MFSKLPKRTLVVLIAIVALLATMVGTAQAAGADSNIDGPAGVPDYSWEYDYSYFGYVPQPWEHAVIIVHVTAGSEPNPGAKNPGIVDIDEAIPVLAEYASGARPYLVDTIISIHPDSSSTWSPILDGGYGAGSRDSRQDEYGDIALGLNRAREACWDEHGVCDVILVTYELPESQAHRRHAMAEAMKLVASGARLHSVVIDLGSECTNELPEGGCLANDLVSKVDPAHVEFSQLLAATGYHAVTDPFMFRYSLDEIIDQRFAGDDGYPETGGGYDEIDEAEVDLDYLREELEESLAETKEIAAYFESLGGFEEVVAYFECYGELETHLTDVESLEEYDALEEFLAPAMIECLGLGSIEELEDYSEEIALTIIVTCWQEDSSCWEAEPGRNSSREADIGLIRSAINQYIANRNALPTTVDDLDYLLDFLNYYSPSDINAASGDFIDLTVPEVDIPVRDPGRNQILVFTHASCNSSNSMVEPAGIREMALLYTTETGDEVCIDI